MNLFLWGWWTRLLTFCVPHIWSVSEPCWLCLPFFSSLWLCLLCKTVWFYPQYSLLQVFTVIWYVLSTNTLWKVLFNFICLVHNSYHLAYCKFDFYLLSVSLLIMSSMRVGVLFSLLFSLWGLEPVCWAFPPRCQLTGADAQTAAALRGRL